MELQVGVKILLKNNAGKYLVVRRSAVKYPTMEPKWDLVGGRINPGSSLMENLQREIMEETGLTIIGEPKLVAAQDILKGNDKHIVRITYIGEADGEVMLSDEHTDFKWLPISDILKLSPLDSYFKKLLDKNAFS